jgi:hypothetical protein
MTNEIINGPAEKQIIVDHERVSQVLGRLMTAYSDNAYPYNLDTTRVPQDVRHMPATLELGSTDHAMFLWTSCYYMRGGIKSVDAFKRLGTLYTDAPELFNAASARQVSAGHIATVLKAHGLGFQEAVSMAWVKNAKRMDERWDGNPTNIFEGVDNFDVAVNRIKNDTKGGGFIGFKEKMVSMITYFLMDEKFIEEFPFPLPVDLHVMRVSIANELVKFKGYAADENLLSAELLAVLRELYYNYAVDNKISSLRLCDAVWLLSEALCGKQPGNITLEPNGRKNRNGRSTVLLPLEIKPTSQLQRIEYQKSCGSCPIEPTCEWNIPGKLYYVSGTIRRRGKRTRLPEPDEQLSII